MLQYLVAASMMATCSAPLPSWPALGSYRARRPFFPGLAFLDDKLIRLDLVPPQLKDVPDAEPEVDAGTDQQSGIVAAVGHQALDEGVGLGTPQGGGGALASWFCHVLDVRPGGYENRHSRREMQPKKEKAEKALT